MTVTTMVRRINPVAKALLQSRRRTQVVPDKKKYNRKKEKGNAFEQEFRENLSKETTKGEG